MWPDIHLLLYGGGWKVNTVQVTPTHIQMRQPAEPFRLYRPPDAVTARVRHRGALFVSFQAC